MKIIMGIALGMILILLLFGACKNKKNISATSSPEEIRKEKMVSSPTFTPKQGSIPKGCLRISGKLLDPIVSDGQAQQVRFQVQKMVGTGATYTGYRPLEGDVLALFIPKEKTELPLDQLLTIDIITPVGASRNKKLAQWVQLVELK